MLKKLIINADDFGITTSVSDAVIEVYNKGSLSSTTLLVTMNAAEYAANLALSHPGLGVGLHFNISECTPLLPATSLSNALGEFYPRKRLFKKLLLGEVKAKDILKELNAQYERILELGIHPTHIDSHQHVHMFPPIFRIVAAFAKEKKIPVRLVYTQFLKRGSGQINFKKLAKQSFLNGLVVINKLNSLMPSVNDSFNSVFDIHPYQLPTEEDYKFLILNALGSRHELMVHPYILSDELKEIYPERYEHKKAFFLKSEKEYQVLSQFSIANWLLENKLNFKLAHYGSK